MKSEQQAKEIEASDGTGKEQEPKTFAAKRWLRGIAVLQILGLTIVGGWLLLALATCPSSDPFDTPSTYSGVESLRDRLIEDLRSEPSLQTFAPEEFAVEADGKPQDYFRIRKLVEWAEEESDDPEEMQTVSNKIRKEYQRYFADYRLTLVYFTGAAIAAWFTTLVLAIVPKVSIALLTLVVSCSLTPPISKLLTGTDFGDTVLFSLPFITLSFAMLCLAFVNCWAEHFKRKPASKDAWIQVSIGTVLLLGGIAFSIIGILGASDLSYRATEGLGAAIAAGIWCLIDGIRDLLKRRKSVE